MGRVELEKLRLSITETLSPMLVDLGIDVYQDQFIDSFVFAVRGYVYAESDSVRRQEVRYPSDWWQAFKERWFPQWLLRRFPVEYTTVVLDVRAIYPGFKPAIPDQEYKLIVRRTDNG